MATQSEYKGVPVRFNKRQSDEIAKTAKIQFNKQPTTNYNHTVILYFKTEKLAKAFVEMVKQFNPKVLVGKL